MSQDFEARRRERLRKQRQQRRKLKMIQLALSVVLFVLVIVIIVASISKCSGNSTPEIDTSVPVTTSVPYDSAQSDSPVVAEQAEKYELPEPSEGENDILSLIKDSGQKKHVYLTFNNGPDNMITPQILDILRRYDIKATFFMIGENIEKLPHICTRIIQEGHLAAPLSYSDNFKSMLSNKSDFIDDINKTYELITQNAPAGQEQFKIVRFPGGSFDESGYGFNQKSYKNELAAEGYYFADWNCTIGDSSSQRSADKLFSYFTQNRPQLNNLVILMRDSSSNQATVDMLERLIKQLLDEGYTFNRLDEIDFSDAPETDDENTDEDDESEDVVTDDENEEPEVTEKPAQATKKPSQAATEAPKKEAETKKPEVKQTEKPKSNTTKATQAPTSSATQSSSSNKTNTATQAPASTQSQSSGSSNNSTPTNSNNQSQSNSQESNSNDSGNVLEVE